MLRLKAVPPVMIGAIAIASIVLGAVMVVAWHTQTTAVIQMIPNTPPVRYNAALALLLSGAGLLCLVRRYRWWAVGLGSLVLLIGGLTLVQYIWRIDLGIDQLLMEDYITGRLSESHDAVLYPWSGPLQQLFMTVDQPLPGRPSPNLSLGLFGVGLSLVLLGLVRPNQRRTPQGRSRTAWSLAIAATSATGVIAIGMVALLGYGARLGSAYTWRFLTGIALPTAVMLSLLGLALVLMTLQLRRQPSLPPWLPWSVAFGVAMMSGLLWQALTNWYVSLLGEFSLAIAARLKSLLVPAVNLVLISGLLLALLLLGVMALYRRSQGQAQRLERLNADLGRVNSLLHTTLESTADGIVVLDTQRQVTLNNERFIRLWEIPVAVQRAVAAGDYAAGFQFLVSQVKEPETFLASTDRMMQRLEEKTFDVFELKNGRILERYGRPQWLGDRVVGKVLSYRDITERHRAEQALRESDERYRSVVAAMAEGIVLQGADGTIQTCNRRAEEILGLTLDQMQGRTSFDPAWHSIREDGTLFPGEAHPAMVTLRTGQPCRDVVMGIHKPGGELTWISINAQPLFLPPGEQPYAVVASLTDITRRKQLADALFHEKELAQVTLHSIGDAVITTDVEGAVEYVNPVAEMLTGWSQAEAQGVPLERVFRIVHEETRQPAPNPVAIALRENRIVELARDTLLLARDGREVGIDDSAAPIRDRHGNTIGAVMVFHDVTHTRQLARQVTWQARHDALTGLVNRREFDQHVEAALALAQQQQQVHALCYLDLDQFKIVNDTCGHMAGDELLRQVTALLQTQIRKTDVLARLGGDEFGILLHQCDLDQAEQVANTLREAVQNFRFPWQAQTFTIGVSIGLVAIDVTSDNLAALLMAADAACYAAKNQGRNRVHIFRADDQALLRQKDEMQWATKLGRALEADQFCLFAQKIAPIAPSAPSKHYEILLRLQTETGKLVPPGAFMPAAERYGLMPKIDRWVILSLFRRWPQLHPPSIAMTTSASVLYAVNISGASIGDDQFVEFVQQQLDHYGVPPQCLCFEITETAAIANLPKARQFIERLRSLGCQFALDDFGTGMSSFAYLKNLPVDYLKIDGVFIKNIATDAIDRAIVDAISRTGQVMGLKIVAEFVENEAILAQLRELGVDYAQGYYIGRPKPLFAV